MREAALTGADARAEAILREASERAGRLLADARREAEQVRVRARSQAARRADAEERVELARAREQARASVLRAEGAVWRQAIAAVRAAAAALPGDPRYERRLARLASEARMRLGDGRVEVTAAPRGGLLARSDGRQIDLSLDAEATRCLIALGDELEALWR